MIMLYCDGVGYGLEVFIDCDFNTNPIEVNDLWWFGERFKLLIFIKHIVIGK